VTKLRRKWTHVGYSYDGINPTKCQCNMSTGSGCKCGQFELDKKREIVRRIRVDWT